ncbi:MAG: leucyl aminopeptidase [Mariprofundales bacterium]|nr:leucyl aminopeptidase [Mariprofundales bacterium]
MITINTRAGNAEKQRNDAVVLPLFTGRKLTPSGEKMQQATENWLTKYLRRFDNDGDFGKIQTIYTADNDVIMPERIILLGVGDEKKLTLNTLRQLAAIVARALNTGGARDISLALSELPIKGTTIGDRSRAIAEGVWLGLYTFDKYKTKTEKNQRALRQITLLIESRSQLDEVNQAIEIARATANGVCFARDLANEPGNICTPAYLGDQAAALANDKLQIEVMDQAAIKQLGLTALLAVNQGSAHEARFIVLRYQGGNDGDAPIALVGKGLTFDSGGVSIKPAGKMEEMKFDMCGSAAVLGIFKAVTELKLTCNLLGVIPSTENMAGAGAYKPGDIITAYNGTTIEVQNTDAEGRLILADALSYAAKQKPSLIIDFATLTGACVVALGCHASGLLGNNAKLIKSLHACGDATHDRVWPLPMHEEYQEQIKSDIADIKNVGGREAGTITAACFLSRFVDELPWAHLDIAGTAWNMKGSNISAKGGTGAGVRLVLDYLQRSCSDHS